MERKRLVLAVVVMALVLSSVACDDSTGDAVQNVSTVAAGEDAGRTVENVTGVVSTLGGIMASFEEWNNEGE